MTDDDEKYLATALMGNEVRLPAKAIKVSLQEFKKLKDAKNADPYGFARASWPEHQWKVF